MNNKKAQEKQEKIIKQFIDDINFWKIKSNGYSQTIFDLTPMVLLCRFREAEIMPLTKDAKALEVALIKEYDRKIDRNTTSADYQLTAIERLKTVLNHLEQGLHDMKTIEKVLIDELQMLSERDLSLRAKNHRNIMLEFTKKYNDFVTKNITSPQNEQELQ